MEYYFFLFCGIGIALGLFIKNIKVALGIITAISFCWFFIYGKWAFLSFLELLIGYCIVFFANKKSIELNFVEKIKLKKEEKEIKNRKIRAILLVIIKDQYKSLSKMIDDKLKDREIKNYDNIITNYYIENGRLKTTPSLSELIIYDTVQARMILDKEKTDKKILDEMYNLIYSDDELREGIYDNYKLCLYICGWYNSELLQLSVELSGVTPKERKKIIHDAIWGSIFD